MKFLIAILFAISTVTSWGCNTTGCKTMRKQCWQPSCGMQNYLTNRDYFMYWWQPAVKVLRLVPSNWRKELAAARADHADDMAAMQQEIEDLREDNLDLIAETREEINSARSEIAGLRSELASMQSQLNDTILAVRQELSNLRSAQAQRNMEWEQVNRDLRTNVNNLRTMLINSRRDDLRSVVLWPSGCGSRCAGNYGITYGIWTQLAGRLQNYYDTRWRSLPCARRGPAMRRTFVRWCSSYPRTVRTNLIGYYDYLIGGNSCSW